MVVYVVCSKCDRASIGLFSSYLKSNVMTCVLWSHGVNKRGSSQLLRFSLFVEDVGGKPRLRGLSSSVGGGTAGTLFVSACFGFVPDRSILARFFLRRLSPMIIAFDFVSLSSRNGDSSSLGKIVGVTDIDLEVARVFLVTHESDDLVLNLVLFPWDLDRGFSFRDGTTAGRGGKPSMSSSIVGNKGKL